MGCIEYFRPALPRQRHARRTTGVLATVQGTENRLGLPSLNSHESQLKYRSNCKWKMLKPNWVCRTKTRRRRSWRRLSTRGRASTEYLWVLLLLSLLLLFAHCSLDLFQRLLDFFIEFFFTWRFRFQEQVAAAETEMKAMQTEHRANLTAAIGQLANAVSQVWSLLASNYPFFGIIKTIIIKTIIYHYTAAGSVSMSWSTQKIQHKYRD